MNEDPLKSQKTDDKLKIKNLEYIALEGGGGKGAVYKGAIEALEKLFEIEWKEEGSELFRINKDGKAERWNSGDTKEKPVGLLDYCSDHLGTAKIRGISGASAGAITAFPLALGLTSKDIGDIVKLYPFNEEFLPNNDLHEGKYRMVGMNKDRVAKFLVGEDRLKKLGENKIERYRFSSGRPFIIGQSAVKQQVRKAIVSIVFNGALKGLKGVLEQMETLLRNLAKLKFDIPFKVDITNIANGLKSTTNAFSEPTVKKLFFHGIKMFGTRKIAGIIPTDNFYNSIGNIIWDRGVFAGFETRDFFYKVMLLAISKDTHFRRGLLSDSNDFLNTINLPKSWVRDLSITYNDRFDFSAGDPNDEESAKTLEKLVRVPQALTFLELFKITNVNLVICVTNATTSQPLYFSHYFTPNFPVIEALGASMSFPIAFKPIYSEANVLLDKNTTKPEFVKFEKLKDRGVDEFFGNDNEDIWKETFAMDSYNQGLGKVIQYIKDYFKLSFSINGNLSFRSFLPYLRAMLNDPDLKDRDLCLFYYNAAFKGLFIDGGVMHNLPISVFSFAQAGEKPEKEDVQNLDLKRKVLSLKLDNTFPPEIKKAVRELLKNDKGGKTLERLSNITDTLGELTSARFAKFVFRRDNKLRSAFNRADKSNLPPELTLAVWEKIGNELIEEYKQTKKGFTPWNKQVSGIGGLLSSLQFGLDQGQIESIADNENIIPLYCYGVDTLDFDLKPPEMRELVKYASTKGREQVCDYFR